MRYLLKQKFWSWGDDFTIKDAEGRDVYFVDGKAFSWGDKLSLGADLRDHARRSIEGGGEETAVHLVPM
jgi:uncharacterized protein YxjI